MTDAWPPKYKCASTYINEKLISLVARSGYSMKVDDPEATEFLLDPSVSDEELGQALIRALNQSRHVDLETSYALEDKCRENYPKWVEGLMTRYGYKTKRTLFKNMLSCDVVLKQNIIIIEPTYHDQLEGWSGGRFTEKDYIRVSETASPAEVGAGLRLAFSRCTSKY